MTLFGPRGFLSNYPPDVVYVVNGRAITKGQLLEAKRNRQRMRLKYVRSSGELIVKPCFVWVFRVESFAYYGWILYIRTLHKSWWISRDPDGINGRFCLKAMQMFPCGVAPALENLRDWMPAFAEAHCWPTEKRPLDQGLALARAVYEPFSGQLRDVRPASPVHLAAGVS